MGTYAVPALKRTEPKTKNKKQKKKTKTSVKGGHKEVGEGNEGMARIEEVLIPMF